MKGFYEIAATFPSLVKLHALQCFGRSSSAVQRNEDMVAGHYLH